MKLDYWVFNSSVLEGLETDRYPILDWDWFYNPRAYVHRHRGFTGAYHSFFMVTLIIFRREYGFSLEWGHGEMSPDEAKKRYHAQLKKN